MSQRISKSCSSLAAAALVAAVTVLAVTGWQSCAWAGTAAESAEREEILSRARAEHAERQRQNLLGSGGEAVESSGETARRQQELDDLSTRLQRAEARRNGGSLPTSELPPSRLGKGEVADAPAQARASESVAVLLVMKPGNRGIRRLVKTADPVLCVQAGCYVSRGAMAAAVQMSRRRALGPVNTLGSRAGACRDSLGCVYRGVALEGRSTLVQPIDLRILHHDRREARSVAVDRSCRVDRFGLVCDGAVEAADYTLWLVPESLADRIGPEALVAAVAGGLGSGRMLSAKAR